MRRTETIVLTEAVYAMWERQNLMPGAVEDVIDRVLALPEEAVNVRRVAPTKDLRSATTILDGWQVKIIGDVDARGRWWRIREVQTKASE